MSLMDAMLLEGYRDPRDVYIALRSDGLKGSGTIDDPYDGGTRLEPSLAATLVCDRFEFVVGTAFPHGVTAISTPGTPVQVVISGAAGASASWFNGTFNVVEVTSPLHLVVRFAGANLPSAPPYVPYYFLDPPTHAGIQVTLPTGAVAPLARLASIYWPVAKVITDVTPHGLPSFGAVQVNIASPNDGFVGRYVAFGPGIINPNTNARGFRYRLNFLPAANVTTPVSCTINKVVHRYDEVMRASLAYSVIHLGPGAFETRGYCSKYVSSPSDYSQIHTGWIIKSGQRILGSGIGGTTLKLALPLDEFNQTTAIGNPSSPKADYAEVSDLTVDCNASGHVAPFGVFPMPVTCGAVGIGGSFIRVHRVRAVQFCDQARAECFPFFTAGSQGEAPVFNVQERCIMEWPGENNTHETSLMNNVGGDDFADARSPVVRHNFADCTYVRTDGSRHSSRYVAVTSITQHAAPDFELFTLVTKEPHHRTAAHNVRLNGIGYPAGFAPLTAYDMPVVLVNSPTELVFRLAGLASAMTFIIHTDGAFLGVDFHATEAFSGTGCVTESNAMFDVPEAFYEDTGSTRDGVVRDNYYSDIGQAVNLSFAGGPGAGELRNAASIKRDAQNHKIAILETASALGFSPGVVVTITGALINGNANNPYNGNQRIIAVSADANGAIRFFHFEMKQVPTPDQDADEPTSSDPIYFQLRWQNPRHVYEGNCYDLYPYDQNSPFAPKGIGTYVYTGLFPFTVPASPPYIFPGVVIRENLFRLRDNAIGQTTANGQDGWACRLDNFQNTLIDGNIIDMRHPFPVHHLNSQGVSGFNNRTSAGASLPTHVDTSGYGGLNSFRKEDGLEDRIQDALIVSML